MMIAAPPLLSLLFAATLAGDAAEPAEPPECYDLVVRAKPIEQIPSVMPECDDCIIMSWPWFLDLKIAKVVEGQVDTKTIRVLTVQHTYLRSRYGNWKLRKNAAGGFNVVRTRYDETQPVVRCDTGTPPAKPYITSENETLDDLRKGGLARYGHHLK